MKSRNLQRNPEIFREIQRFRNLVRFFGECRTPRSTAPMNGYERVHVAAEIITAIFLINLFFYSCMTCTLIWNKNKERRTCNKLNDKKYMYSVNENNLDSLLD